MDTMYQYEGLQLTSYGAAIIWSFFLTFQDLVQNAQRREREEGHLQLPFFSCLPTLESPRPPVQAALPVPGPAGPPSSPQLNIFPNPSRRESYTAWCGAGYIESTTWSSISPVLGEKVYVEVLVMTSWFFRREKEEKAF
jgi:hypothetical protein